METRPVLAQLEAYISLSLLISSMALESSVMVDCARFGVVFGARHLLQQPKINVGIQLSYYRGDLLISGYLEVCKRKSDKVAVKSV
jgi:hypothetical protein